MDNNRVNLIDFTIASGPSQGMRIPGSKGIQPVNTMPQASYGGMLEPVPHRFVMGKNEAVVTLSSPQSLSVAVIEEFF